MPVRIFLLLLTCTAGCWAQASDAESAIRKVLSDQTAAWNRGDLETFMHGYQDSPETAFVGSEALKGYQAVLERYRRRYPDKRRMGTTSFHQVEVRLLNHKTATVIGRFELERGEADGGPAAGIFTLVFVKTPAGWKIVLDHTS